MKNNFKDPYVYLFPMGIVSAIAAVLFWLAFAQGWLSFFPRQAHANLMFFGFLWSFIAGFLMTAIPKMTQSGAAQKSEIFLAIGFVIAQWILNYFNLLDESFCIFALQILLLVVFVARRFYLKSRIPFEGFVFMPFAFLSAIGGLGAVYFFKTAGYSTLYLFAGQAFVLNLICGLGSRLIPVISRVPQSLNPDEKSQSAQKFIEFTLLAIGLNISFILENFQKTTAAFALRFFILAVISFRHFKVLKKASVFSFVGVGLRLAVGVMLLSYLILIFYTENPLPLMHLVYIGGLAMLTLMVATRVSIAHGGHSLDLELKSKTLILTTGAFLCSAFARFINGAQFTGLWIYLALIFFLIALISWANKFLRS